MAGGTFSVFDRLMFELRGLASLFQVLMTFEAEFAIGFQQQPFVFGSVRLMAAEAFAIFDRLMAGLGVGGKSVMTSQAESLAGFENHFRVD